MLPTPCATTIPWTAPVPIEVLRVERVRLPRQSGLYLFTNHDGAVDPRLGNLYLGKAKSLYARLQSYLVDPASLMLFSPRNPLKLNSSLKHAGKAQLLVEVQQKYREAGATQSYIWVRWHVCPSPRALEKGLIQQLRPAFNTQDV
jgi:hypothetical protein